ncbi:metallothionein-like protein 2A [Phragmites australis]|uniref:metallothionein-like protein 2A n=1 Tax=Phragmites australis TaxID=29695 RepID=UPI002D79CFD6|nr:metallothionein-like protein 2A [Phragmites australis]
MSCCGGNCGCGSGCKCGSGCGGCKKYPEMAEVTTTQTVITDVAPPKGHADGGFEGGAVAVAGGAENEGCTCNPCTCNPCTCK